MAERKFEGTEHATVYAKYRPSSPQIIINKILDFLGEKFSSPYDNVLDVGCGTGQNCQLWAPYFKKIIGTDVSEAQIIEARKENRFDNITYIVCPAENNPLPDHSLQLIAAANSLHWFDMEAFFNEAKRLLVPNGVFAAHGYHVLPVLKFETEEKTALAADIMKQLVWENIRPFLIPNVIHHVSTEFSNVVFPFAKVIRHTDIINEIKTTIDEVVGLISSYSPYQEFKTENPGKANAMITDFKNKLLDLKSNECIMEMRNFLILCRD